MTTDAGSEEAPLLLQGRMNVAAEIRSHVDGFDDVLTDIPEALRLFIAAVTKVDGVPNPFRWLMTQAVNELFDLLVASATGEGRSAIKASRSLLDLLVAALGVTQSAEAMDRYADHRDVVFHQAAAFDLEDRYLRGRERRSATHWRRVAVRESKPAHDDALRKYGGWFARGWERRSLADRSRDLGLAEDYEFFRLASAILHGSAGGILGTYAQPADVPVPVLRVGPALALCPTSFILGVGYFDRMVTVASGFPEVVGDREVHAALTRAREIWPDYRRVVYSLDGSWWHHEPLHDVLTLLVVFPYGGQRWYVYDPVLFAIRRAHPPGALPKEQQDGLDHMVAEVRRVTTDTSLTEQPVSIAVEHVRAEPLDDASWEHAGRLLIQRPLGGWQGDVTPDKPRVLSVDRVTGHLDLA